MREGYRFIGMEITEANHVTAVEWLAAEEHHVPPEPARSGQGSLFGAGDSQ